MANSFALDDTPLIVVQDAAGAGPPHWPAQASREQVKSMSGAHLTNILQFYHLPPGGTIKAKACKVWAHLGVRFSLGAVAEYMSAKVTTLSLQSASVVTCCVC